MHAPLVLLNLLLLPSVCLSSEDASDVTWGHAINSRKALEDALQSNINFLEADVSLGSTASANGIPVMAHPPQTRSDISLEAWMAAVIKAKSKKGVKLDFKSTSVLQPALKILDKTRTEMPFPLWLNADILPGPGNANANHVDAKSFLTLCRQYFPNATLSIGWATQLAKETTRYAWKDVSEMAQIIRCQKITQPISFPVRGILVKDSVPQFVWLLNAVLKSTLTVWSGVADPIRISDLLELRKSVPASRVYYDLPGKQNKDFLDLKNTVTSPTELRAETNLQLKILSGSLYNCRSVTILGDNTVVYGGEGPVAVVHPMAVKKYADISGKFYPCDTEGTCERSLESRFTFKISDSLDYWNSNAWANPGQDILTIRTNNIVDDASSKCSVSFHIIINNPHEHEHYFRSYVNASETCPSDMISSAPEEIHGDMYVGVVIEGNRPITIENLTVATTTGGVASITSTNCLLISICCAVLLCIVLQRMP